MKTLLIIALVFTVLTVACGIWESNDNDTENAQLEAYFTLILGAVAGIFYALWALGLLIHYLLN